MISFHYEAALEESDAVIDLIHACGVKAGIVINPDCPVEKIFPYLGKVDYVLLMSVFAGFGGQKFIEDTYARIKAVKAELQRIDSKALIEVDGGVTTKNAGRLAKAGVDILVAGSAVFRAEDPAAAVTALREG
jgi:ribulose-phosphate 3-epimerase